MSGMLGRRCGACLLVIALGVSPASGNGRSPSAQSIEFRAGSSQDVVAGLTLGAVISHDGGTTWRWFCESAVGYGGIYDPDYAYASSGTLFATSFDGLRANRDGCTFALSSPLGPFASQVELGATSVVHVAAADPADSAIYSSSDDGVTVPVVATPGVAGDWWLSLRVAPSDSQRVYLTGYRLDGNGGTKSRLLFTSSNGATSFSAMTTTGMTVSAGSDVSIVGVSPTTPTTVFAKVTFENGGMVDAIYRSTDAGASWTRLVGGTAPLAFLVRASGELVVAGPAMTQRSSDGGMTWTDIAGAPVLSCLAENAGGEVWACTQHFVTGYAIMKSSDLATWTGVLRFRDLAGPVDCPAGTVQHDTCLAQWCALRMQFSITADPTGCEPAPDGLLVDGPVDAALDEVPADAAPPRDPGGRGCCDTGGRDSSTLLALMLVVTGLRRSRRRRVRA